MSRTGSIALALAPWIAATGCGRVGFDASPDGGASPIPADAADVVSPCFAKPFGPAQRLAALDVVGVDDWAGAPTLGGTQFFFHSYRPASHLGSNFFVAQGTPPASYGAAQEVVELSSDLSEFQPTLSEDGLDLIFASDQGDPYLLELFEAVRTTPTGTWSAPARIAALGTDTNHQLDPWLTADGLALYYAVGPNLLQATLWRSTRAARGAPWAAPSRVDVTGTGPFSVSPTLSADEREIFFVTDLDAAGNLDVVTARRPNRDAAFGPLERVTILNTLKDEAALRLSADGQYLYLVQNSDYELGGDADISFAARTCD